MKPFLHLPQSKRTTNPMLCLTFNLKRTNSINDQFRQFAIHRLHNYHSDLTLTIHIISITNNHYIKRLFPNSMRSFVSPNSINQRRKIHIRINTLNSYLTLKLKEVKPISQSLVSVCFALTGKYNSISSSSTMLVCSWLNNNSGFI